MPDSGSPTSERDDLGTPVALPPSIARVVSLVPSLTEAVAATAPELLVGATAWCTHPRTLQVTRVRGTKNPDLAAVIDLRPDVVLANDEENREADIAALRAAGVVVWVTAPRSVTDGLSSLGRMLGALQLPRPAWLEEAVTAWQPPGPQVRSTPRRRAVIPIWRRPWMAVGRDTFAGDVLRRLGVDNVLAGAADRYPRISLANLPPVDLVVLPDEPYAFSWDDGPEAFRTTPVACVSGRHLTWYGPSLVTAPELLRRQLEQTR